MKIEKFLELTKQLDEDGRALYASKNRDYASDEHCFANFDFGGHLIGADRYQILAVYLWKHLASIFRFIRDRRVDSEPIRGRIIDARNYLAVLNAFVEEDTDAALPTVSLPEPPAPGPTRAGENRALPRKRELGPRSEDDVFRDSSSPAAGYPA